MPKTTVLQANQTQFFSSKRLFISKIIMPITSTAVAVMFTFSFSSAFAATTENLTTADAFVKSAVNVAEGQARLNSDLSKAAQDYAAAEASKVAQMILSYLVDQPDYDIDTTAGMDAFKAEFTKWALGNGTPTVIGTGA